MQGRQKYLEDIKKRIKKKQECRENLASYSACLKEPDFTELLHPFTKHHILNEKCANRPEDHQHSLGYNINNVVHSRPKTELRTSKYSMDHKGDYEKKKKKARTPAELFYNGSHRGYNFKVHNSAM